MRQCEAFNSTLEGTSHVVKDTADHIEHNFADHKPDFTLYDNNFGKGDWELTVGKPVPKEGGDPDRGSHKARVRFAWAISVLEVKISTKDDLFIDAVDSVTKKTTLRKNSETTCAQMTRYVIEVFLRQHREFVFTVLITGDHARLMRWDRCGLVVSESFNYVDDPTPLLLFIRWLATASRAQQGFDTSIQLADDTQIEKLKKYRERLVAEKEEAKKEYTKKMAARELARTTKVCDKMREEDDMCLNKLSRSPWTTYKTMMTTTTRTSPS